MNSLLRHPLRSFLTAATSAVAIAVTVNVISLVHGMDEDLRRDTQQFGRTTVDVGRLPVLVPGLERTPLGEAERVRVTTLLEDLGVGIVPRRLATGKAKGDEVLERTSLIATSIDYPRTLDVRVVEGRWFEAGEAACVLDQSVATSLFPDRGAVGRTIEVGRPGALETRRVVGILDDPITERALFESFDEGRGARTLTSAVLSFRNVYLPEMALGDGEYSGLSVACRDDETVTEVAARLRAIWPAGEKGRLLPATSVGVFVRREWMAMLGNTSQTGAFLGNIVWIIIVGVAVVLLTTLNLITIQERYDEFAIRRVEGASRADIAWQVTGEGVVTSLLGGLAGLPLGRLGAEILRDIVDFPFRFETRYAIYATGIAILIGLVASVLPARHAATLQPARVLSRRTT